MRAPIAALVMTAAWTAASTAAGAQEARARLVLRSAEEFQPPASVARAAEAPILERQGQPPSVQVPTYRIPRSVLQAHVINPDLAIRAIDVAQDVELKAGETLVMRTTGVVKTLPVEQATRAGAHVQELPVQVYTVDGGGQLRESTLVTEYTGGGLRLADDGRAYSGRVYVSLQDTTDRTAAYTFPQPAGLLVTAGVSNVDPERLSLLGTNQWEAVTLGDLDPTSPVPLRIRTTTEGDDVVLAIPVVRPQLELRADRDEVEGFGLAVTEITVSAPGVPNPEGRLVALQVLPAGAPEPRSVMLNPQGVATAKVRSIRTGPVEIVASSVGLADGRYDRVTFIWPIAFVVFSLGGGFTGALVRVLRSHRRSRGLRVLMRLGSGAAIGLAVAALYAIGVNVTPVTPSATAGEALVFGLGFIGAYWGLPSKLASNTPTQ